MRWRSATYVLSLLASGCFAKTQYKPTDFRGGYEDHEVQTNVHFVSFSGNGLTRRDEVIVGWHRRATELCGGRDRYTVIDHNTQTTASKASPDRYSSTVSEMGGTTSVDTTVHEGITVNKSRAEGYIRCNRAAPSFEAAEPSLVDLCESGDAGACGKHAMNLSESGKERKALVYVSKACQLDMPEACMYAAQAFEVGRGIERDVERASAFWKRACRLGNEDACEELVRVTAALKEGPDAAACRSGDDEGCAREAEMRLNAGDREGAIEIVVAGCIQGSSPSCMKAAQFFEEDGDVVSAIDAYKAACQSGLDAGCDRFAELSAASPAPPTQ